MSQYDDYTNPDANAISEATRRLFGTMPPVGAAFLLDRMMNAAQRQRRSVEERMTKAADRLQYWHPQRASEVGNVRYVAALDEVERLMNEGDALDSFIASLTPVYEDATGQVWRPFVPGAVSATVVADDERAAAVTARLARRKPALAAALDASRAVSVSEPPAPAVRSPTGRLLDGAEVVGPSNRAQLRTED